MDFDEPDQLLSNKPSRAEQAKAKHGRKKGKPVAKPASMNYDGILDDDSEGSKLFNRCKFIEILVAAGRRGDAVTSSGSSSIVRVSSSQNGREIRERSGRKVLCSI
jgi:hypothetical protein